MGIPHVSYITWKESWQIWTPAAKGMQPANTTVVGLFYLYPFFSEILITLWPCNRHTVQRNSQMWFYLFVSLPLRVYSKNKNKDCTIPCGIDFIKHGLSNDEYQNVCQMFANQTIRIKWAAMMYYFL